jgi:hypothetical protein
MTHIKADKIQAPKNHLVAQAVTHSVAESEAAFQLVDNRPEATVQRKLQNLADNSPQTRKVAQMQKRADEHAAADPVRSKTNQTGLPDALKSGIENLSGHSLDDVKVHYNSAKPEQLQAHAYAQGTDIHLGAGQEKHLPHEAWHVVQQKQGRVRPTMQLKGKIPVNDDAGLEKEADVMGAKALQRKQVSVPVMHLNTGASLSHAPVQRMQQEALAYIKVNNLGIYARAADIRDYVSDAAHDRELRVGLLAAWNAHRDPRNFMSEDLLDSNKRSNTPKKEGGSDKKKARITAAAAAKPAAASASAASSLEEEAPDKPVRRARKKKVVEEERKEEASDIDGEHDASSSSTTRKKAPPVRDIFKQVLANIHIPEKDKAVPIIKSLVIDHVLGEDTDVRFYNSVQEISSCVQTAENLFALLGPGESTGGNWAANEKLGKSLPKLIHNMKASDVPRIYKCLLATSAHGFSIVVQETSAELLQSFAGPSGSTLLENIEEDVTLPQTVEELSALLGELLLKDSLDAQNQLFGGSVDIDKVPAGNVEKLNAARKNKNLREAHEDEQEDANYRWFYRNLREDLFQWECKALLGSEEIEAAIREKIRTNLATIKKR